jgi:hypothetical protein
MWVGGALLAGWLTTIVVSIDNESPGGAPDLNSLEEHTVTALHTQDAEGFQLLFTEDSVADGYAANYLNRLGETAAKNSRAAVEKSADATFIVVDGPGTCTAWQVVETEKRWYLDGTPPVLDTLCGNSEKRR